MTTIPDWFDKLDDEEKRWRMFCLDNGGIVCSSLLTHQDACRRAAECDQSRCAIVVEERYLTLFELRGEYHAPARFFTSHSVLGSIPMFWTLLYRAWCEKNGTTPKL